MSRFHVYILINKDDQFSCIVDPETATIGDLKYYIRQLNLENNIDYDVKNMRLTYNGKQLIDDYTLKQENVPIEAQIKFIYRHPTANQVPTFNSISDYYKHKDQEQRLQETQNIQTDQANQSDDCTTIDDDEDDDISPPNWDALRERLDQQEQEYIVLPPNWDALRQRLDQEEQEYLRKQQEIKQGTFPISPSQETIASNYHQSGEHDSLVFKGKNGTVIATVLSILLGLIFYNQIFQ